MRLLVDAPGGKKGEHRTEWIDAQLTVGDQGWLIELETKHLLANGYEVQDQSSAGSHVNVGRTATAAVLTGGLSLLFGASRSKGSVTLMYLKKTKAKRK
jgi:hypothetical protein